jgi:2,4-dienoyl-CoA reductase-like NADH-dependent reductase (Old Yellow Enzyme family)
MNQLFTPVGVGRYTLPNRLVMAPMTRSRAKFDGTPGELAAEYYAQRAGVGLIVTEGTQPSDDGQGSSLRRASTAQRTSRGGRRRRQPCMTEAAVCSSRSCTRDVCRTPTIRRIIVKP